MSVKEIRESLQKKQAIIGKDKVIKGLKTGKVKKIFLSSNCSENMSKHIRRYSELSDVEVVDIKQTNVELGVLCKKPFSISTIGIAK